MIKSIFRDAAFVLVVIAATIIQPVAAQSPPSKIGIVIMHGKGGSPTKHVAELASSLQEKGYLVTNLEMPWSGRRDYDVNVAGAEKEVESALDGLRANGAANVFIVGHSLGGVFALYVGSKQTVDGIIAIAPGGSVGSPVFREKLGESVEQARKLVAEGKGEDKARFFDFEGAKGTYPIIVKPANYLSWFDPDGAMGQSSALRNVNLRIPVLLIVPKNDYPALRNAKQSLFDGLPKHPLTKLYEPDSNHLGAPSASRDEIMRWTMEVANNANLFRK